MTKSDRELGMNAAMTRRDFLNGVSVAVGSTLLQAERADAADLPQPDAGGMDGYPPARTGLRGSHAGSFEVTHAMRDGRTWDAGEDTRESYDLVVVGGGLSGLAAAYFFRKKTSPDAKILILDNHDDFGGHAKRNEFTYQGRTFVARGGTAYIERPATFTADGRDLLKDIGVDYHHSEYKVNRGLYASLGMRPGMFFDRETFGVDRLVVGAVSPPTAEFLAKTPLSEAVRKDILRLYHEKRDYLAGMTTDEKIKKLRTTSYRDYLLNLAKVRPEVLPYFQQRGGSGVYTLDATSAWWSFNHDLPGFSGLELTLMPDAPSVLDANRPDKNEPTSFHFPDGNAAVARLLVRSLIPKALPGKSMADAATARVNYPLLDDGGNTVRIRLSSTAVKVRNNGDPGQATEVDVSYVQGGKTYRVHGKSCVLACNHAVIPYLCPDLPAAQREALHMAVRAVQVYTQVLVRDWKAFQKAGVSGISCPGSYYDSIGLGLPIDLGDFRSPRTPEEPMVISMYLRNSLSKPGLPAREQMRQARGIMYQTTFETYERQIRDQLGRALADGGFDPARDIVALTVNRWPHGYSMGANLLFDPDWSEDDVPWVRARKRHGRITIANADAQAVCLTQAAFDEAHRAIDELFPRRVAWWNRV